MNNAFVQIPAHNISVKTWVSADNDPEVSSLSDPFPANLRHYIKVYWTGGYTTDIHVYGLIAHDHPQLRYDRSGNPADWDAQSGSVVADAEEYCGLLVDSGTVTARIQCTRVEFKSAWTAWVSVLSTPLEVQIPVT